MRTKVVIFGTGDFAELVEYCLTGDDRYEVVGFTETAPKNRQFKGLIVVPFQCIEKIFSPKECKMFIAVGYSEMNNLRAHFYYEAKNKGYDLLTYIHPKATVAGNADIGDNCFIFEENNIQPYVTIENNVILWSGNHIGHHSRIRYNTFISSHVVVSGNCYIGNNCFIGVNASIIDGIHVTDYTKVGAGAVITKDIYEADGTYVGVPARRIK